MLSFFLISWHNKNRRKYMETVKIKLENIGNAANPYNENFLNDELNNYIITSCSHINYKERLEININGISKKEEQEHLTKLIHTHYQSKVNQIKKIDKYDDYFRIILLLLGIILIIISEHLTSFPSEIFLIAGWVVIWEMVYDILFTGIKRKRDLKLYKKLANCEINFVNETVN